MTLHLPPPRPPIARREDFRGHCVTAWSGRHLIYRTRPGTVMPDRLRIQIDCFECGISPTDSTKKGAESCFVMTWLGVSCSRAVVFMKIDPAQEGVALRWSCKEIYLIAPGRPLWTRHQLFAEVRFVAESEGFEPPIALRLCLISSQVHSTGLCQLSALFTTVYQMFLAAPFGHWQF